MKNLSWVTLSILVVLTSACSKTVRMNGADQSNTTDLSGVTGQTGSGGQNPSTGSSPSPTPSSSSSPTSGTSGSCSGGQVFVGNSCVCPGTENWNGTSCVSCADNQLWNSTTKQCDNTCSVGSIATAGGQCVSACGSGQSWDGTQCVSSAGPPPSGSCGCDTSLEVCDSYKELTSPFVIPARDSSHTCYYIKLSSAVASQDSSDYTVHDTHVLARDHDDYSNLNPTSPHIIGSSAGSAGAVANVQFVVQGPREAMLVGNDSGSQDVYVDNFVLAQLTINGWTNSFGAGTADSLTYVNSSIPGDDGYIQVNGSPLTNYIVGAAGGTDNFMPMDFGSQLQLNTPINLKTEALDCGIVGQVSDIYLLFR